MRTRITLLIGIHFLIGLDVSSQTEITGRIADRISGSYLKDVKMGFEGEEGVVFTDKGGYFRMSVPTQKSIVLTGELVGYGTLRMPIEFNSIAHQLDLGVLQMSRLEQVDARTDWVELSVDDLEGDRFETENVAGILSAGKDLFSRAAAFDFGVNFFRPRFLGSQYGIVMLNGVSLNKVHSGRPEWSNWGGLNDALRQQESYAYMQSSPYALGGMALSINMLSSARIQKKGMKMSTALSNKNYQTRIMATYSSGQMPSGWAYMVSASWRYAQEGYRSGTSYKAYSFLASLDKMLGDRHFLNATFIYALNSRGKSSPMTEEVYALKSNVYNSYWGPQEDQKRNSREKRVLEPIFQLNHEFYASGKTRIHSHFTYQSGSTASSRLDYGGSRLLEESHTIVGGGSNPDPSYYQKLPSYFLRDSSNLDYGRAYLAEQEFKKNGQIDWSELYAANRNSSSDNYAIYVLYEDRQDNEYWSLNSGFSTKLGDHFTADGMISIERNATESYAYMLDLLGGKAYLDVDPYENNSSRAQNNLQEPNRLVLEHEKFRYNYELYATEVSAFIRSNYATKNTDVSIGADFVSSQYQRNGIFENGAYPGTFSLGKSEVSTFQAFGIKTSVLQKFTGRHVVTINANYLKRAPVLNHIYSNVRVSNETVEGLDVSSFMGIDIKYIWRHRYFNAMLSGYYLLLKDESKISFYYADGLTGIENRESSAYVQEVLTGIDRQNTGLEFSLEVPLPMNLKLKAVAAFGRSLYTSNPQLYLNSNSFDESLDLGKSFLKGYYDAGGPQEAFSLGFEYSSPNYWWLSCSVNFFNKSFVSVAPITRSRNFFLDTDGLPIHDLDPELAQDLLHQESLPSYMNVNLVGGKSWKIKNTFLGFFASINNLSNSVYKTGGYEQSRTANFLTMKEDKTRSKPLFGSKYWFGYGTTFFTSFYIRI